MKRQRAGELIARKRWSILCFFFLLIGLMVLVANAPSLGAASGDRPAGAAKGTK